MSTKAISDSDFRLPTNVKPTHYDVTIRTDMETSSFQGRVRIDLDVQSDSNVIVFHTADLELDKAVISTTDPTTPHKIISQITDNVNQRTTLTLADSLQRGSKVQLQVTYKAIMNQNMVGYYMSSYKEADGIEKYYTLTQFESTEARRAIPCWDEPLLKATWCFAMITRRGTVNISNMPAISTAPYRSAPMNSTGAEWLADESQHEKLGASSDWIITKFQVTPPMSSYLAAFASGDFKHLESSYTSPISGKTRPLRIYATSDIIHQAQFALDLKAKVIPIYEQVFDVEYPLPKLDTLVAHDFDAGAMENWGLITGRTSALLLDPKRADVAAKKQVVFTQSHEVAHMWFGNITTMQWWDNLYLNEGFATLMGEVIIPDKIYPEWKVNTSFIADHLSQAFALDAQLSSHPIEVPCPTEDKINQIFDSLSYSKAGSVLRMLSNYVGEETFLKGVSIYLKSHLFANSVTKDLWDGISTASGLDISKIMDNWVGKIGFPVITVTEDDTGIRVRQDRFLASGPAEPQENETIWSVPLALVSIDESDSKVVNKSLLLDQREMHIPLDTSKPFKLNAGTSGFYRVLYTPERLRSIGTTAAKDETVFDIADRMGLIYDASALARAGFSKMSDALSLINSFSEEKEYLVWSTMSTRLGTLADVFWEEPEIVELLNRFRQDFSRPTLKRLGYESAESDADETKLLRTSAITQAANSNDPAVLIELKTCFEKYMQSGDLSVIHADMQRTVFKTAVRHSDGRAEFDRMKAIYHQPPTPSAKTSAIYAMTSTKKAELIHESWEFLMNESRDQDLVYFFSGLAGNCEAKRIFSSLFKENYYKIQQRLHGNTIFKSLVSVTFNGFTTMKDYNEISEFFKDKDTSRFDMNLAQALESVKSQSAFVLRSTDDVKAWLRDWDKSAKL